MVHCTLAKGVHMQKVAPGETGIEGYGKKMKQRVGNATGTRHRN